MGNIIFLKNWISLNKSYLPNFMAIENVLYQKQYDSHTTGERVIVTLINGDITGFSPEQVRIAQVKQNTTLGGHWREYPELYGIIGKALFTLEDVDTKKRIEHQLATGDRLFIPAKVALKIQATRDTVITVCSSKANRDEKTHKYIIS